MLVCNVSQSPRRAPIAASVSEATAALDTPGTGNIVFATLVDDPASVGEHVDAFFGQIMLEVANATVTVIAGLAYAAAVSEAAGAADSLSATVISGIAPINTVLPAISGTTQVGSSLTTTNGTWTGTPTPTFTYQWKRGGSNISGATASTYLLVTADLAATITVTVNATNIAGSTNATSTGVGPVTSPIPKSIDGTAGGQFSGAGPGTITLSTTQTNDVAILVYFHENNATTNTIASVTSPHLTWTKRSNWFTSGTLDYEIWWAPAAAVLTSEVITVTLTGPTDDAAYHAFGVHGCSNISSPWDGNASLTTAHSTFAGSSLTLSGISTNSANPMIIGMMGSPANVRYNNPAGTTQIRADQANGGGTLFACLGSWYQNNSSALSSASYTATLSSGSGTWGMVIDALA